MTFPDAQAVQFFPVVHLLTGPPGLRRNGGIWKGVKSNLAAVMDPPRVMVQALHFVSYDLSQGAWDEWLSQYGDTTRLVAELEQVLGASREMFVDSGGFQLLHSDKIDLGKWGMTLGPEDVLNLQSKYRPQRVASLDSPLAPGLDTRQARALRKASIRNAVWLAEHVGGLRPAPIPYLVVHGRTAAEVREYLRHLDRSLPKGWLRNSTHGIALGSQVPLAARPKTVMENVGAVLGWMASHCSSETPLHIFGVGESLLGSVVAQHGQERTLSFDNSTWIQKAFRMKIFDPTSQTYGDLDPLELPRCPCAACEKLDELGSEFLNALLLRPAYSPLDLNGKRVNRSDVFALVGLHNLTHWRKRLAIPLRVKSGIGLTNDVALPEPTQELSYTFPLRSYAARAPNLLTLPCSKGRPYKASKSHKKVIAQLESAGLAEGRDFDRITFSGLHGPVHWEDEEHPAILSYDFPLGNAVSDGHIQFLRLRTATVLGVIRKRYRSAVAYLPSRPYWSVFGPVARSFRSHVVRQLDDVAELLGTPRSA